LSVLFILTLKGCSNPDSELTLYDQTCENLSQPLGIATNSPRLSWKIRSNVNGTSQKAYQIIAASEIRLLNENKADLWNSGKIISGENVLVPWQGKNLTSGSLCYWKVRIWDENDQISEWSDPVFFSIGLLEKSDWQAHYIGFTEESENCISPQLRKTFTIDDKSGRIFLHVNSLGYHEVWLNGEKVGENVLTPAVSQFNRRSLSNTYDISSIIKKGRNDLVLWTGQGWYSKGLPGVVNNGPVVMAQVEQINRIRRKILFCSDSTWMVRNSGYSTIGTWRPGKFGGELVNGSELLTDMSQGPLDKTSWSRVKIAEVPDIEVTPQMTESNRIMETFKPASISLLKDSTWLIDMGKTLTGWFEIHFPQLIQGQEITMEYCDHLDENGKTVEQGQIDKYIASGRKDEYFLNKFNYHGFRYIKISNLVTEPVKENISAYLIHTGYGNSSSFECSDADLNTIHTMIQYTLRCLSLGGYLVDCPQIERLGYGGDGNASTETAQTMFDLAPLYANWLQAWRDCNRDDGGMPHTAPNPYSAGGGPYWCGFIITASWRTWQNYGDMLFLERSYPVMQKWLDYVERYSPTGLLEPWSDTDYRSWYLGDWATPLGTDQTNKASIDLVNNCFITICYETMQKIAEVLGKADDMVKYSIRKDALKKKIQDKFFDPVQKTYASGSQIDLTYPLLAGVVPDSLIETIKKNLKNVIEISHSGHFACGLVGIPVFTEWAVKNREADLMYSMLKKKDYPGYLYMVGNGATTTWEHWNGARSRIHNCYNGIGSWFYQALGGIKPDEDSHGYRHVFIDPQIPEGITWAKTSKETPFGTIIVDWKTENTRLNMEIKLPVGCSAIVAIPDNNKTYTLNGKTTKSDSPGIELESGDYRIAYELKK
jgi:alpha-L-rhamnosidase